MFKVENLKTEERTNPLGIDVSKPVFSWRLNTDKRDKKQTAYQIKVASTKELLAGEADMWDSAKIISDEIHNISYQGKNLKGKKVYYWQVRVWDEEDTPSLWSEIACFEMALMEEDAWQGDWIGLAEEIKEAPYFRKEFTLDKEVVSARAYISGLGFYQLYLNGEKVGDRVLEPAFTDYEERVLYSVYDLSSSLKKGENALGVVLGRGRYAMHTPNVWGWEKTPWQDQVKFILELDLKYKDGSQESIVSDQSWKSSPGPTKSDCLYAGEVYDAREEKGDWTNPNYEDSAWQTAKKLETPKGKLEAQSVEAIKEIDMIKAKEIRKLANGYYLYDFGTVISGWVRLKVEGEAGTEVKIVYGEKVKEDGRVNIEQGHVSADIQTDTYILKGQGIETWEPMFSYKGFQYVELKGFPGEARLDNLEAKIIHTAVNSVGEFSCSEPLLNKIHSNTRRAILNNLHSIPTDTPMFEKNGWTGDAQLTAETAIYNFNMLRFYQKWMLDFKDSLKEDGELPPIVPTSNWGYSETDWGWDAVKGAVPAWDSAYILISWWTYLYYGDKRILKEHYTGMKKYLNYLKSKSTNYIVEEGLGDWLAPKGEDSSKPEGFRQEKALLTSTAYFYLGNNPKNPPLFIWVMNLEKYFLLNKENIFFNLLQQSYYMYINKKLLLLALIDILCYTICRGVDNEKTKYSTCKNLCLQCWLSYSFYY